MGWDAVANVWRKLVCNPEGKLIIDPSEILEDDPTDGEVGKAPTSNWAHDHAALPAVHHERYTDVESRGAINNILNSVGRLTDNLNCNYKALTIMAYVSLKTSVVDTTLITYGKAYNSDTLFVNVFKTGVGQIPCFFDIYNGTAYERVVVLPVMTAAIATHTAIAAAHHAVFTITEHDTADRHALANLDPLVCSEAEADARITTHAAIAAAHHARYTDAEAVAAVGYGGTKYWSCAGVHFDAQFPATDNVEKSTLGYLIISSDGITLVAQVSLPDGATVTNVIVIGNAAAGAETWILKRLRLSDMFPTTMAAANINTADSTITSAGIDNSLYAYILITSSLDLNDQVYGATITYTL